MVYSSFFYDQALFHCLCFNKIKTAEQLNNKLELEWVRTQPKPGDCGGQPDKNIVFHRTGCSRVCPVSFFQQQQHRHLII